MRNNGKGLGFGILLLTVGAVWLLSIAKIVTWSTLNALITLWPLILVAIGIGFIFRSNRLVRTLTWLVLLAVVIGYGYFAPSNNNWFKYDLHFGDETNYTSDSMNVTLDKKQQNEKAELLLDYGAMKINIDSKTSGLLDATINDAIVKHSENLDGSTASIKFEMKDEKVINLGRLEKFRSDYHLSKDIIWNLKLNTGAIDGNLDLSGLKVENLNIKTGVSSLDLDMGSYNTVMKIESGASKIDITLPEDTGMKIKLDGGLNNTNLEKEGWTEEDDWYYSPDYNLMDFKIEAEINNGFGNLSVENR
jgi:hypothetical protein